jgi:hypothetical protein
LVLQLAILALEPFNFGFQFVGTMDGPFVLSLPISDLLSQSCVLATQIRDLLAQLVEFATKLPDQIH